MTTAPDNEATDDPKHESDDGEWEPTPGEILILVGKWLRHRLGITEEKPKWTEAATAALTLCVAIAAFWSAWIFQGQLTVARKTMEAQTRPWVGNGKVEVKETTFLVYPDNPIQARTQFDFVVDIPIKNVGNSPALHVGTGVNGTMTEQIAAPSTMDRMMQIACGLADGNAKIVGDMLFPNSPYTTTEWPANIGLPFTQPTEVHRAWIAICIAYSGTPSNQQLHHTKLWMASWPFNGNPTEIRRTTQPRVVYYSLPITQWGVVRTEAD